MSLPLHDLGSVKVNESVHSFLRAQAMSECKDLSTLCREILTDFVKNKFHVLSMARDIHNAKQLGEIEGDMQ
jgi:hypothetical protein